MPTKNPGTSISTSLHSSNGGSGNPQQAHLTTTLLNSYPDFLTLATEVKFLSRAGSGNLPKPILSKWLSQDRLYAQAYISFIGALIARVDLPYAIADKSASLRWRIVNLLTSCLENIHKDLKFFEYVAKKYDLKLDFPPVFGAPFTAEKATKQYIDLFRAFWTDPSMSLMEGMIILWAMEYCHLTAWTYAKSFVNVGRRDDLDGGALKNEFIPNWTSPKIGKFVAEIAELTNLLAEREGADKKVNVEVFQAVWNHVLAIERSFWPEL